MKKTKNCSRKGQYYFGGFWVECIGTEGGLGGAERNGGGLVYEVPRKLIALWVVAD